MSEKIEIVKWFSKKDASWELLQNSQLEVCRGERDSSVEISSAAVDPCPEVDLSSLIQGFESCISETSRITCLQQFSIKFLLTAVRDGVFLSSSSSPLAAWIRLHLEYLISEPGSTPAISLSPHRARFPLADLADFYSPALSLQDASSTVPLASLFTKAIERGTGIQEQPRIAFLYNQICLRAMLCLLQALMTQHARTGQLATKCISLVALTLEQVMHDQLGEWIPGKVNQCAVSVLGVKEAPSLLAEMTRLLLSFWANEVRDGPEVASFWGENVMSGKADLVNVISTSLLLLRYLAGAGAQDELGNTRGGCSAMTSSRAENLILFCDLIYPRICTHHKHRSFSD